MGLPDALPRDEIVARAEWLIGKCPKDRYNLVGSNCEHVANWCVTGGYFESLQARRLFMFHAYVSLALTACWRLSGKKSVWLNLMLANSVWGPIGPFLYHTVPYRKWRDILLQWPGYEPQRPTLKVITQLTCSKMPLRLTGLSRPTFAPAGRDLCCRYDRRPGRRGTRPDHVTFTVSRHALRIAGPVVDPIGIGGAVVCNRTGDGPFAPREPQAESHQCIPRMCTRFHPWK